MEAENKALKAQRDKDAAELAAFRAQAVVEAVPVVEAEPVKEIAMVESVGIGSAPEGEHLHTKEIAMVENTVLEYVNSIYPTNLMPDWATDAEQVKIKEILDGFERFKKWAVKVAESK